MDTHQTVQVYIKAIIHKRENMQYYTHYTAVREKERELTNISFYYVHDDRTHTHT